MVPPELITVRLDLGWHAAEHAGMFAAEAHVSNSHELLALEVIPTRMYDDLDHFTGLATTYFRDVVFTVFNPDPF